MRMIVNKEQLKDALRDVLGEFFKSGTLPIGDSEILDVKQASVLLNLARATVYEKTSLRLIPHYKKGKKITFKKSELIAWMETGKVDVVVDDTRQRVIDYLQTHQRRR